jgi:CelD/BcsL family acetyltransferase involved in cellulose biosynthesis
VTIHCIDPLQDSRWNDLVERSPASTLFHSTNWLKALKLTYGYEPLALTDAAPGKALQNGLLCCRVTSWMTGRRIVSLPFSDHCEPLSESTEALQGLLRSARALMGSENRYVELRPCDTVLSADGFRVVADFWLHRLDLRRRLAGLFAGFHANHTRRAIRRAARRGVQCEAGRSPELLRDFYAVHVLTRRRHGAPVQPYNWFGNLAACFGHDLGIYVARHQGQAIGAILMLRHKNTLVYKYGGLDRRFRSHGAMPMLFWRAIQDAHADGLELLDLGRSDLENAGLVAFKDHLGARRTPLRYYRCGGDANAAPALKLASRMVRRLCAFVPSPVLVGVSGRLYRHLA